jgi:hypothetical protein
MCVGCDAFQPFHKPPLLQRHFSSYHKSFKETSDDLFSNKTQDVIKRQATLQSMNISLKCLQALYCISLGAAYCKTLDSVPEEAVMPTTTEIASIMLDDQTTSQISCSDTDRQRRIVQMVADVTDQVVEETEPASVFAFQPEGGMEISNTSTIQLVKFFVRRSSSCGTYFIL